MSPDAPLEQLKPFIASRLDPLDRAPSAPSRSDFDLNPTMARKEGRLREAAVLIPLVERDGKLTVLLTRRSDSLRDHTGQVAFPGGRLDPGETAPAAALREAREEIALDPAFVTLAGLSTDYETGTGFHVTPVVGFVRPGFTLRPDEAEVADVFEVPFAWLMDPANHERRSYDLPGGGTRWFHAIAYRERTIWGATAGMVRALFDRLYGEGAG